MDDEILALLQDFADLLGPETEPVDDELIRELLTDLAAVVVEVDSAVGVEIAEELVGFLSDLVAEQPSEAPRCAGYLTELAVQLPTQPRTVLLAGVDYSLGGLAALEGRWDEAGLRMARVRPLLGPTLFPEWTPGCDHVLGEVAFQQGDTSTARQRWEAARAEFLAAERWEEAAVAAGGLAEIAERAGNIDGRAAELWRETADLFAKGGDAESARRYAVEACRLALHALQSMPDEADTTAGLARARAARELALRHGLATAAVQLLNVSAICGADQGLPWLQVAGWFAEAREECRALTGQVAEEKIEIYLAGIGLAEGSAAMNRNLPVEAEAALRPTLPVFRAHGCTQQEALAVRMLQGVRGYLEPDPVSALEMLRNQILGASALLSAPVGPGDTARPAESSISRTVPDPSGAAAESLPAYKVLALTALEATQALQRGDPRPAERCLDQIEHYLATAGPTIFRDAVRNLEIIAGVLRAGLAQHTGGLTGGLTAATAALTRVETQALAAGAGLHAAQVAVQRGRMLLAGGKAAEAVQVLAPAVLALDAVRFSLDGADRRRRWAAAVAQGFDAAYRAAARLGDTRLLAELLEVARANAVPSPVPQDGSSSTLDELLAESGIARPPDRLDSDKAITGATALLSDVESRTLLGLPAYLRTPWDTVALAEPLQQARRYHDPVRAELTVDWMLWEVLP